MFTIKRKNKQSKDIRPLDKYGRPHGESIGYWDNGRLHYRSNYVDGLPHGLWESYDYNGKLLYRGYRKSYDNGRKMGFWFWHQKKEFNLKLF